MRVGPMPIHAADKLMRVLKKNGREGELFSSGEHFTPEEQKTGHPRTESPADLLYLEFPDDALELLRADLIRLALLDESMPTGNELEGEDWVCPKCGKTFEQQGRCPTHDEALVTFEQYAAAKKTESNTLDPVTMVIVTAVIVAAIYYFTR